LAASKKSRHNQRARWIRFTAALRLFYALRSVDLAKRCDARVVAIESLCEAGRQPKRVARRPRDKGDGDNAPVNPRTAL
jgi:hypothetical protein